MTRGRDEGNFLESQSFKIYSQFPSNFTIIKQSNKKIYGGSVLLPPYIFRYIGIRVRSFP